MQAQRINPGSSWRMAVPGHFARQYEQVFTQQGKFKSGSDADIAQKAYAEAEQAERKTKERLQRLKQAASDFEKSRQSIAEADTELKRLDQQKIQIEGKLSTES